MSNHSKLTVRGTPPASTLGMLFTINSMEPESADIVVTDLHAVVLKFFNIPDTATATLVEHLYAAGSMPNSAPGCCAGCLSVDTRHRLGMRVVTCPNTCEAVRINACVSTVTLITPGVYRVTVPTKWLTKVVVSVQTVNPAFSDKYTGVRV